MNLKISQRLSVLALILAMMFAGSASAAMFSILYDDFDDQTIGTNNIVGSGMFSYDGPIVLGAFSLGSLTGIGFSATFDSGESYGTVDIDTDLFASGIFVYDAGAGNFGMVFTGFGGILDGSFDLSNGAGGGLSHEPTDSIFETIGCCGGDGVTNLYGSEVYFGDYQALSAVPIPAAAWLFGSGLLGLIGIARRKKA